MLRNLSRHLLSSLILTVVVGVVIGLAYPLALFGIGQAAFKNQADGSLITRNGEIVGAVNVGQAFVNKNGNPLLQYFQSRPSATSPTPYNAAASGASNLGPSDPRLVGFIPGFNTVGLGGSASATNPFATPQDPYCVPVDPNGNPVLSPSPGQKYQKNKDGSYVCDPNTIPERAIAYRELNGLPANTTVPVDAVTASASGLDPDISVENADLQASRVARVRHLSLSTVMGLVNANTSGPMLGFLGERIVNVLQLNLALDALRT
ncbi:MAG TPA: potassium-transporting ATPase subunit C [Candidatus Binatia bacterium]|nr:potassium-transporting ATPase subunit C [Candidatus Binatia bacterium]